MAGKAGVGKVPAAGSAQGNFEDIKVGRQNTEPQVSLLERLLKATQASHVRRKRIMDGDTFSWDESAPGLSKWDIDCLILQRLDPVSAERCRYPRSCLRGINSCRKIRMSVCYRINHGGLDVTCVCVIRLLILRLSEI